MKAMVVRTAREPIVAEEREVPQAGMGMHAIIENFRAFWAQAAVERMMSGRARFRVVWGVTPN